MRKVLVIRHAACETLGTISEALGTAGVTWNEIRTFDGDPVPRDVGAAAGLIVMGGPMGVYEHGRHPFLLDEMRLIEKALKHDLPVLGVCLGCQLLASVLGATVAHGERKEIGWYVVHLKDSAMMDGLWRGIEPSFVAFHWHGDIFDLPKDTISLASSDLTECQALRYGTHAYGLLFHAEVTHPIIRGMLDTFQDELAEEGIEETNILQSARDHLPRLQQIGSAVFTRWSERASCRLAPGET